MQLIQLQSTQLQSNLIANNSVVVKLGCNKFTVQFSQKKNCPILQSIYVTVQKHNIFPVTGSQYFNLLTLFLLEGGVDQFDPPPPLFFYLTRKVLVWGC